ASLDGVDGKIKEFLGDQIFEEYKAYDRSQPDRTAITNFKDQMGSTPQALTADQENKLLEMVIKERESFDFTIDPVRVKLTDDLSALFTEDRYQAMEQDWVRLHQRYVERAQSLISPEQLEAFQAFLTNQRRIMMASMQMNAKMLGAKPSGK